MKRTFSKTQRIFLFARSNGRCSICGTKISLNNFHADHRLPFSKGGCTSILNGQATCPKCNLAKGDKV